MVENKQPDNGKDKQPVTPKPATPQPAPADDGSGSKRRTDGGTQKTA